MSKSKSIKQANDKSDVNHQNKQYLDDFIESNNLNYAILLKAPWGAGKTHFIKKFIISISSENKPLYVSLNGISTIKELNKAIAYARFPSLQTKVSKTGKQVKNLISSINILGNSIDLNKFDVTELILFDLPNTLIFDDIERCTLKPIVLFGAINKFVEHEDKRVIFLANEEQLIKAENAIDEYNLIKEKLIGQTLTILPDFDAALTSFINENNGAVKKFYLKEKEIIKIIFKQASYNNLRSLKQTLWNFNRLYKVIEKKFLKNETAMRELLSTFIALSLEIKSANVTKQMLNMRYHSTTTDNDDHKQFQKINNKYDDLSITNARNGSVIPVQIAENVLINGIVDKVEVNKALSQSQAFRIPDKEQEWQTIWWAFFRNEENILSAKKEMEQKFIAHQYTDPGELLHVFTNMFTLKEMGLLKESPKQIISDCKRYIRELSKANKLRQYTPVAGFSDDFNGNTAYGYTRRSYMGLMYPENEQHNSYKEFEELFQYLRKAQHKIHDKNTKNLAPKLLEAMIKAPHTFNAKISAKTNEYGEYAWHPILHLINEKDFSKELIKLPHEQRHEVLKQLSDRYKRTNRELEFKEEKIWINKLYDEIREQLKNKSELTNWQVDYILKHTIGKELGK